MKINLLLDAPGEVRSGYLNIDAFADGNDERINGCLIDLDDHVDDAECEEIIAVGILDYYSARDADKILKNWLRKLAHGGTITIGSYDVVETAKAISNRKLSPEDITIILYGEQGKPWQFKKTALTVNQVATVLETKGLTILKKRIEGLKFIVVAERP